MYCGQYVFTPIWSIAGHQQYTAAPAGAREQQHGWYQACVNSSRLADLGVWQSASLGSNSGLGGYGAWQTPPAILNTYTGCHMQKLVRGLQEHQLMCSVFHGMDF
jgi:hypothetical protein